MRIYMKTSELIECLKKRMEQHGDVEVRMLKGDRLRPIFGCFYNDCWKMITIEE